MHKKVDKILFLTSRADIGGGPKHLLDLVSCISQTTDFQIYIGAPKGHFFSKYEEVSKKCVKIPFRKFSFIALYKLIRIIKDNDIKTVHSHGRGAGIYSRLLKLFTSIRVIHTFHGIHREKTISGQLKFYIDYILKFLTDSFICVSPDERKLAVSCRVCFEESTSVILNGIDAKNYSNNKKESQKKSPYVWGTIARFTYPKGLDIAVSFIDKYQDELRKSNCKFIFQGDGDSYESITNQVKGKKLDDLILTPGSTNDPHSFFKKIDFYISFSRWEGFPISVLEAMASKKPVLLSDVVGHQFFIENNACLSYRLESFDEIIHLMKKIMDQNENNELKNANELIDNELSIASMVKKTLRLYNL